MVNLAQQSATILPPGQTSSSNTTGSTTTGSTSAQPQVSTNPPQSPNQPPNQRVVPPRSEIGPMTDSEREQLLDRTFMLPYVDATPEEMSRFLSMIPREKLKDATYDQLYAMYKSGDIVESPRPDANFIGPMPPTEFDSLQKTFMNNDVGMWVQYDMRKKNPHNHPLDPSKYLKEDPNTGKMLIDYNWLKSNGGFISHVKNSKGIAVPVSRLSPKQKMALRNDFSAIAGFQYVDTKIAKDDMITPVTVQDAVTNKKSYGLIAPYNLLRKNQEAVGQTLDTNMFPTHTYEEQSWFEKQLENIFSIGTGKDIIAYYNEKIEKLRGDTTISNARKRAEIERLTTSRSKVIRNKGLRVEEDTGAAQLLDAYRAIGLNEKQISAILTSMEGGDYSRLRRKIVMGDYYADLGNLILSGLYSMPIIGTIEPGQGSLFVSGEESSENPDREDPFTVGALVATGWAYLTDIVEGRSLEFNQEDVMKGDKIDMLKFSDVSEGFAKAMGISPEKAKQTLALQEGFFDTVREVGEKGIPAAGITYVTIRGVGKKSVEDGMIPFLQTKLPSKYGNKTKQEVLDILGRDKKAYEEAQALYLDGKFSFGTPIQFRKSMLITAQDIVVQGTRGAKNLRLSEASRKSNKLFDEARILNRRAQEAPTVSEKNALRLKAVQKHAQGIWTSLTGLPTISPIAKGEIASEVAFAIGGGTGIYLAQKYFSSGYQPAFEIGGGFIGSLSLPTISRILVEKGVEPLSRFTGNLLLASTQEEFSKALRTSAADLNLSAQETKQLSNFYNNMISRMSGSERRELVQSVDEYTTLVKELSELPGSTITPEDIPVLIGDLLLSTYLKGIGDYLSLQNLNSGLSESEFVQLMNYNRSLIDARQSLQARMAETLQKTEPFRGNLSETSETVLSKILDSKNEGIELLDESVKGLNEVTNQFRTNLSNILRESETHAGGPITQQVSDLFDLTIRALENDLEKLGLSNAPAEQLQSVRTQILELKAARDDGLKKYLADVESGKIPMDANTTAKALHKKIRDDFNDGQTAVKTFYDTIEKEYSTTYADQTDLLLDLYTKQAEDSSFFPELFEDSVRAKATRVSVKTPREPQLIGVANESASRFFTEQLKFKPTTQIKTPSELIKKIVNQMPEDLKNRYAYSGKTNMDAFMWYRKFTQEVTPDELRVFGELNEDAQTFLSRVGIDGLDQQSLDDAASLATLDLSALEMDLIVKGLNKNLANPKGSDYALVSRLKNRLLETEDANGNPTVFIRDKYGDNPQEDTEFLTFYKEGMSTTVRPHYEKFDDKLLSDISMSGELDGNYFKEIIKNLNDPKKTNPVNPEDTAEHINKTVLETARRAFGTYDPKTNQFYLVAGSDGAMLFRNLLLNHYREVFFNTPQGIKLRELVGEDKLPLTIDLKGDDQLRGLDTLKNVTFHKVDSDGNFVLDPDAPIITDDDIFSFGSLDELINTPYRTEIEAAEAIADKIFKESIEEAKKVSELTKDRIRTKLYDWAKRGGDAQSGLSDMDILFRELQDPRGFEQIKKVRSEITDEEELAFFDRELRMALVTGVIKETTSRPETGLQAGRLLFDIGGATKILQGPEYVNLNKVIDEFHPDLKKTLSLFDDLSDRVLKRGAPLTVQSGPKNVDTLAVLNRGRQIQLRQVSPMYVAMEIVTRNSQARKFNSVATILSDPVLTREFIKMVESGKALDPQMERRFSTLFLRTSLRMAADSYQDEPVVNDRGNLSGKEMIRKFEESLKMNRERYVSPTQNDPGMLIEQLKKYNPYFVDYN